MKETNTGRAPGINIPSAGDTSFPPCARLSNGVPLYLIGNGPEGLLRIEFVFNAGQRRERVHLASAATNAMLTEGTELRDAASINNLIDSTGALFSHTADKDSAGLVTVTLTRKLDEVMSLAEEVLFHPTFPEREFRMMKEKRMQAFLTGRQRTAVRAREEFYRALCGDTNPYGRVTRAEDYDSLNAHHLRDFHTACYIPENMYITVAGRNPQQVLPLLENYFSGEGAAQWTRPVISPMEFGPAMPGFIFCEVKDSVQSTVRMGWKGITRDHPDYLGLQVATMLLGGYFGSRLMRKIREEKGYTYGIHAVAGAFHGIGYIAIMTDVATGWREETLTEIKKEISRLQEEEVSSEELLVVRNHTMGEIARMFDGPFQVAEAIKGIVDYDAGHDYYTRFVETVNNITPGKIKELFNTYFRSDEAYEIIAGVA